MTPVSETGDAFGLRSTSGIADLRERLVKA